MPNPHAPKPLRVAPWVALLHSVALLWIVQSPTLKIENGTSQEQRLVIATLEAPSAISPEVEKQAPIKPQITPKPTIRPEIKPSSEATQVVQPAPNTAVLNNEENSASSSTTDFATQAAPKANSPQQVAIVMPSSSASYLNNPKPPYPAISRRLNEQGVVMIRVLINTDGRAEQTELFKSSGYTRLDDSALKTVSTWRFVPGTTNGVPQAMWFNVPVNFVLE